MRLESPALGEKLHLNPNEGNESHYEPGSVNIESVRFSNSGPWKRIFENAIRKVVQSKNNESTVSQEAKKLFGENTLETLRNNPGYQKALQALTLSWESKLAEAHHNDLDRIEERMAETLSKVLTDIEAIEKNPQ